MNVAITELMFLTHMTIHLFQFSFAVFVDSSNDAHRLVYMFFDHPDFILDR